MLLAHQALISSMAQAQKGLGMGLVKGWHYLQRAGARVHAWDS